MFAFALCREVSRILTLMITAVRRPRSVIYFALCIPHKAMNTSMYIKLLLIVIVLIAT